MTRALVCSRISVKAFLFMEGLMSVAVVIVHGLEHGAQQNLPIVNTKSDNRKNIPHS